MPPKPTPTIKSQSNTYYHNKVAELDDMIKLSEKEKNIELKEEYTNIFKIIEEFVIKEKCLLYGGMALNEILPHHAKFYDSNEIPDFDIYHPNASYIAIKLKQMFVKKKKNASLLSFIPGVARGTIKAFYDCVSVLDINEIDAFTYEAIVESYQKHKTQIKKYMKKDFLVSPYYLKMALHFELAKPLSAFRWKKLFERLNIYEQNYFNKYIIPIKTLRMHKIYELDPVVTSCIQHILTHAENKELLVNGQYAYMHYMNENLYLKRIVSKEYNIKKDKKSNIHIPTYSVFSGIPIIELQYNIAEQSLKIPQLIESLKKIVKKDTGYEIIHIKKDKPHNISTGTCENEIFLKDHNQEIFSLVSIRALPDECMSFRTHKKLKIIVEDGLLRTLYMHFMRHNEHQMLEDMIHNMELLLKTRYKKSITTRFSMDCIGHEYDMLETRKFKLKHAKKRIMSPFLVNV